MTVSFSACGAPMTITPQGEQEDEFLLSGDDPEIHRLSPKGRNNCPRPPTRWGMKKIEMKSVPGGNRMEKAGRCALFLWLLAAPQLLAGTVYYVATNGNDSFNGLYPSYMSGANGPLRTLQRAADLVKAGDTVQIRGGVYQASSSWSTSGSPASPIIVTNYPGEVAVVDGNRWTIPAADHGALMQLWGDWVLAQQSRGPLFQRDGRFCRGRR